MAKVIEFYIPQRLRKVSKSLPPAERGKLLQFPIASLAIWTYERRPRVAGQD